MRKTMMRLKALRPHVYGTRRLTAGDEYEAPQMEALAQVLGKRAKFIKGRRDAPAAAPAPPSVPRYESEPEPEPESTEPEPAETPSGIEALRIEARDLGIDIDGRWGATRLRHEIAKANAFRRHDEGAR